MSKYLNAVVVHANDTACIVESGPTDVSYKGLCYLVSDNHGNDDIELVQLETCSFYLNEEGKVYDLPINPEATLMARQLGYRTDDVLVGTVVFLGPLDDDGNDTDVPDAVCRLSQRAVSAIMQVTNR